MSAQEQSHSPVIDKLILLEQAGTHLIKVIGTYEVVLYRLIVLYLALGHLFK